LFTQILKRDGRNADYDIEKIEGAIEKAMSASGRSPAGAKALALDVEDRLEKTYGDNPPDVESIQDIVESVLMERGYPRVAKRYILYRADRTRARESKSALTQAMKELTFQDASLSNMKRDNANIDGDTAMGVMLKYGSESAKSFYSKFVLTAQQAEAHESGDIHIHDFDFYTLTTTCCQIDIEKLFRGGFSTGHGFLREPNSIQSYAALACIAIQSNQNDQHGGQSIPNFDYGMAPGVAKTFRKLYASNLIKALQLEYREQAPTEEAVRKILADTQAACGQGPSLSMPQEYLIAEKEAIEAYAISLGGDGDAIPSLQDFAYRAALSETERECLQAMEALVHNLNTMHSRAGAQTPFSSINYGTDTSPEGRMVIKNVLLATEAGLGGGETPIFPIHIFKVKEGVNYNPGEPNYDLFKLACRVSAKRLFPNFSFLDAPFNIAYYRPGRPETEVAYMGCRTRVLGNTYDPDSEISYGRGNLSFTSINLPRIALMSHGNVEWFFEELERKLSLVCQQLLDRFQIQSAKKVKNFPFLMGQGIWIGSDGLMAEDEIGQALRHGTLSVGFIGLAETLVALTGAHHAQSEEARNLGLEIVGFMRDYLDKKSREEHLNFTLLATPAEGLAGRFVALDRKRFGLIEGVTDRDYYTNSFHVPVYFPISAFDKIQIEAPYHALTNAGHITYVELDGDAAQNIEAFEIVVRAMKEAGVGYGSVNHPVDRDPVCGYNGIIADTCPACGRAEGDGLPGFERIRRITGYLVGTLERFNDAKRSEEADRVKHGVSYGEN